MEGSEGGWGGSADAEDVQEELQTITGTCRVGATVRTATNGGSESEEGTTYRMRGVRERSGYLQDGDAPAVKGSGEGKTSGVVVRSTGAPGCPIRRKRLLGRPTSEDPS